MRPAYGAEEVGIGQHLLTIVVDVANVMGSRPDGWWRDRAGAAVRLHGELVLLAASGRAVPPDEPAKKQAPPAFVMVLEGAARAAAARIAPHSASLPPASPSPASPSPASPSRSGLGGLADEVRPGEVTVVQAPGSGDDAIVAVVRELVGGRLVVTADRELRRRCVAAGATIAGPGWLLGLLGP
jgi:8-oxo-dGTP diphosphatase